MLPNTLFRDCFAICKQTKIEYNGIAATTLLKRHEKGKSNLRRNNFVNKTAHIRRKANKIKYTQKSNGEFDLYNE